MTEEFTEVPSQADLCEYLIKSHNNCTAGAAIKSMIDIISYCVGFFMANEYSNIRHSQPIKAPWLDKLNRESITKIAFVIRDEVTDTYEKSKILNEKLFLDKQKKEGN